MKKKTKHQEGQLIRINCTSINIVQYIPKIFVPSLKIIDVD